MRRAVIVVLAALLSGCASIQESIRQQEEADRRCQANPQCRAEKERQAREEQRRREVWDAQQNRLQAACIDRGGQWMSGWYPTSSGSCSGMDAPRTIIIERR